MNWPKYADYADYADYVEYAEYADYTDYVNYAVGHVDFDQQSKKCLKSKLVTCTPM